MTPTRGRPSTTTSDRRCVVTGIGVLSPIGCGYEEYSAALRRGDCGLAPLTETDTGEIAVAGGGEVKNLASHIPPGAKRFGRYTRLAIGAALQAVDHAGLSFAEMDPCSGLLVLATAMGPCDVVETRLGSEAAPTDRVAQQLFQSALNTLVDELKFSGEATQLTHGCSAANYALTYARDAIYQGRHDVALVGGIDTFAQVCLLAYDRFGILASEARPFDANCEGMTVGEGAGFVVLEAADRARQRRTPIYAEIAGGATTIDAYQTLSPSPDGQALHHSMLAALESAGMTPSDVDYISASAPGTPLGDRAEARAIRRLFEPHGNVPPVSATKSQTGNCHGASALLEAIACVAAINSGFLPPTIGLEHPNEDATFDLVVGQSREQTVDVALNNATGFGGADSSVVIRRFQDE
jgi:3-oxoacyl-[acyl-carrier-protein] synthase II